MNGVARESRKRFNPRLGRGVNPVPPGWQAEMLPTTLASTIVFPFYSILFYSILFYSILFYAMLCYAMLCYAITFYSILFLDVKPWQLGSK